jgi:hypothetical protein
MTELVGKLRPPIWLMVVAGLGLAWNLFGVFQFFTTLNPSLESLTAQGLTPDQAAVMISIPFWMKLAFAIGVFGGVLGSALLVFQTPVTRPILLLSLLSYCALYVGDITHGVFAALGTSQVIVLTSVVAIAAGLLWVAHFSNKQRLLA